MEVSEKQSVLLQGMASPREGKHTRVAPATPGINNGLETHLATCLCQIMRVPLQSP